MTNKKKHPLYQTWKIRKTDVIVKQMVTTNITVPKVLQLLKDGIISIVSCTTLITECLMVIYYIVVIINWTKI
ncbi:hypothetical protein [Bacillus albus]|uniref:hypothetical protein n=1 Tax=Bacillus albus TaxID=2026189 RepID=UPI001E492EC8|nr:hypothetical protein [Bacillus albus]